MCSIIGFCGVYQKDILLSIFENSKIRGVHSFGYSYYDNGVINTKKFLNYDDFISSINKKKPNLFIAHFRYSTSGDYKVAENNQPLTDGNVSIAFNGIISQKSKLEMEAQYGVNLKGDNDGYLLLNKIDDENFITSNSITFAVVGLKDSKLFAIKNKKRPLWQYKGDKFTLIASTNDIMKRAGIDSAEQIINLKRYEYN